MADDLLVFLSPLTALVASVASPSLRKDMKERRQVRRREKRLRAMGYR